MVGDDQAVEAVFHAQRRVLVRQDPLDEDLHARDVAHPLEEIPGHVRRFHAGHAREVDAVVVGPAPRPRHDSGLVAVLAIPGVLAAQPEQSFLVAARHAVHGHDQHRAASALGALDQRAGDVPAGRGVELKPDRRAARLGGVLDRRGGRSRKNLQMAAGFRRAGDGELALGMEELVASRRRNDDRRAPPAAEELAAHVDLGDVVEAARAQLELQEALAIGTQRDLVVDARGHVAEMRRGHGLARHRLEIEHVDRLGRRFDEVLGSQRRPEDRIGKPRRRRRAVGGERAEAGIGQQRTAGQELQEPAAAFTPDVGR